MDIKYYSDKLNRNTLLFLSFSSQTIIDILSITLPIYALSLSASPFQIGLLATSRGIVYCIFPFIMGYLSEFVARKKLLAYSMVIDISLGILFYFSRFPLLLIVIRLLEGVAMAIFWPTIEPLFTKTSIRKISNSLREFNVSWGVGQMIGPVIGGSLISFYGVKSPFIFIVVIAAICLFLIYRYIPFDIPDRKYSDKKSFILDKSLMRLISIVVLLGFIEAIFFGFFPAFGIQLGITPFEVGLILFIFGISRVFFFYYAPLTRIGAELRIVLSSFGLLAVYTGSRFLIYLGVIGIAASLSLVYSYALENMLKSEEVLKGRRAGIFEGALGIGFTIGPFLAGFIVSYSFSSAFMFAFFISVLFIFGLRISVILDRLLNRTTTRSNDMDD